MRMPRSPDPAHDPPDSLGGLPLAVIADSGVVGLVLRGPTGAIEEANARFLEMAGCDAARFSAGVVPWLELFPAERREEELREIAHLQRGRPVRGASKELRRTDGSALLVRMDSTPLADGRILSLAVDVSEAELALRSRDDILAIVSHDLRNPLSVIAMSMNVLEAPLPEERRAAQVGIVRRAVAGMSRLISDLMDATQVARGNLRVDPAAVAAAAIVRDAQAQFSPLLAAKSQDFRCACEVGDALVLADRERVMQVLANLIGNAHKFTPEGGRIDLEATATREGVRFTVRDTGPGLAADDLPHVFDRFWQARKVRRGGVGLGLPITKGIVDAHGGRIWAESVPGLGAAFHFTLPRVAPDPSG